MQTSMGSVQVTVGKDVGKCLKKKKKKKRNCHLSISEAVEDSEETVEGRNNSCPDSFPMIFHGL